jgi:dihydrofolate reductase
LTRKVVHLTCASLDGVVEAPTWAARFLNDELAAALRHLFIASDALLLGRVTHETLNDWWLPIIDEHSLEPVVAAIPKLVATRARRPAPRDATALTDDAEREVEQLKSKGDGDVLVFGSGTLAAALTRVGLIDEFRIIVCPTIVGEGARLLADTVIPSLHLISVVAVSTGAAVLNYGVGSRRWS